jgi:hypothetical protein
MRQRAYVLIVLLALGPLPGAQEKSADFLDGFHGPQDSARISNIITTPGQFNGYTNYWHSNYWRWRQYGNLFQLSHPDVEKTIAQNKLDTAEEIGIPGLLMEEGFLAGLLESLARGCRESDHRVEHPRLCRSVIRAREATGENDPCGGRLETGAPKPSAPCRGCSGRAGILFDKGRKKTSCGLVGFRSRSQPALRAHRPHSHRARKV